MRRVVRWAPAVLATMAVASALAAFWAVRENRGPVAVGQRLVATAAPAREHPAVLAVREYFRVTDIADGNGQVDLVDTVTAVPSSPANFNFRVTMADQLARGRFVMIHTETFSDWRVQVRPGGAMVAFSRSFAGQDVDATTMKPLGAGWGPITAKYEALVRRVAGQGWRVHLLDQVEPSGA